MPQTMARPTPQATVHQKPMVLGPVTTSRTRAQITSHPMRMLSIRKSTLPMVPERSPASATPLGPPFRRAPTSGWRSCRQMVRWALAGWSSQVARWAHNPKVAGSNPAPATGVLRF